MALSYYSNWDAFQHEFISDTSHYLAYQEEEEEEEETIQLPLELDNDDFGLPPADSFFSTDSTFFEPVYYDQLLFPQENYNPLPQPEYNNDLNNTFIPEAFQANNNPQEFQPPFSRSLKRQKLFIDDFEQPYSDQLMINHGLANELHQDNYHLLPDVMIPPLPDFSTRISTCPTVTTPIGGSSLSAQSIAARQRRRKISEKTQELGKLIPGGQKMNTAEMFGAAYKYLKYLQAQVGVLQFMGSYQEEDEEGELFQSEELHGLLESTLVQEKLYSTERCLVPRKFVQALASQQRVFELEPHVLKEVVKQLNP